MFVAATAYGSSRRACCRTSPGSPGTEIVAGQTTGRLPRWHPPGWQAVEDGVKEILRFVVTPGELPSLTLPVVDPGRLAQLLAAAALLYAVVRTDWRSPPEFVRIGLVFGGLYCAFLLLTMSVFDAVVPIDERLLVPLVPTLAVGIAWLIRGTPVAAFILACVFAASVLQQVRTVSLYGIDYSGRVWSAARFDGVSLPPGRLLSNWPAAVAYSPAVRRAGCPARPTHTRMTETTTSTETCETSRAAFEKVKRRSCYSTGSSWRLPR